MLRILPQIFTRLLSHKRAPYLNQSVTRWQHSGHQVLSLQGLEDHYNGLNIDLNQVPLTTTEDEFSRILVRSLSEWHRDKRTAVWLQVPILHSCYIPLAARLGFEFHHAEHRYAMLKLWMQDHQPDATPRFATHQLGVGGVVIKEETKEVLVVRDKNRPYTLWKFPGGLADLGEDIESTAVREVFEETGVKAGDRQNVSMSTSLGPPSLHRRWAERLQVHFTVSILEGFSIFYSVAQTEKGQLLNHRVELNLILKKMRTI